MRRSSVRFWFQAFLVSNIYVRFLVTFRSFELQKSCKRPQHVATSSSITFFLNATILQLYRFFRLIFFCFRLGAPDSYIALHMRRCSELSILLWSESDISYFFHRCNHSRIIQRFDFVSNVDNASGNRADQGNAKEEKSFKNHEGSNNRTIHFES